MKDLQKQVKSYINANISASLVFLALGIMFVIMPGQSLDVIRWVLSGIFILLGLFLVVRDANHTLMSTSTFGVILLIIGLIFAVYPGVMNIMPIMIGIWLVVSAVSSLRFAPVGQSSVRTASIATSVLSLICGILLIVNPWAGNELMMLFIGIILIIHSVSNFVDTIVLKKNINEISNTLKSAWDEVSRKGKKSTKKTTNVDDIQEAEVKKTKKTNKKK